MNLDSDQIKRSILDSLEKADQANVAAGWGAGQYSPDDLRASIIGSARKQNPEFDPEKSYADQMTLAQIHGEISKTYHGHLQNVRVSGLEHEMLNDVPGALAGNAQIQGRRATPFDTPRPAQHIQPAIRQDPSSKALPGDPFGMSFPPRKSI